MPLFPVIPALLFLAQVPSLPCDLADYIEEIQRSGATESARGNLDIIARILVGETILTFQEDAESLQVGARYSNAFCFKPGMSPEELSLAREASRRKTAPVLAVLRRAADTDQSGFVSTKEGVELRRIFEFGVKLAFVSTGGRSDKAERSRLLEVSESEFETCLKSYQQLSSGLARIPDITIPQVPAALSSPRPKAP